MGQVKVLTHRQHRALDKNHRESAKAAHLRYITDCVEGIKRVKQGKGYQYTYKGTRITDEEEISRIRSLALPPSWTNVWISPSPVGHIQGTGTDMNGRKQYRYHTQWNALRNETKFHRLLEFGKSLPQLRKKINSDLKENGLTENKVLATVVELMEQTFIRIGNSGYEKLYGSYGLTTLKDKHVSVGTENISFTFTGKKGIEHSISVRDRRLARIVKQCRDIPGKELFQYYDKDGNRSTIDSGMVNAYIKAGAEHDFSAKDFRTWAGSVKALECLRGLDFPESATAVKKQVVEVLDQVAEKLGNTRTVCKKYYVHPLLIDLYEGGKLQDCLGKKSAKGIPGLDAGENALICILEQTCK
ncbi:MAG: DNA topoisomerase IB [Chitinophagaceae bacterium]|nr:MAG: DNA topoisomerase IB [Chitinophagaceae bacterium]